MLTERESRIEPGALAAEQARDYLVAAFVLFVEAACWRAVGVWNALPESVRALLRDRDE